MKGLVALLVALWSCLAFGADHDASYYKRTHTSQPRADVYLGPGFNYSENLGLSLGLAVIPKKEPFIFTLDLGAMKIDGANGTTPFELHGCTFDVPYSASGRTKALVSVGFKFKL